MKHRNRESEFKTKGLPKGWIKTTLETTSQITLGRSPPSSTYNKMKKGLSFYQGKADFGMLHPTPRVWCVQPQTLAEKNDILMSVRAPVGSLNISTETCGIGRGLAAIRPKHAVTMYIFYQLRYLENQITQLGTGTTFKAITGNQVRTIPVIVPPLAEQHRIVAKIESIFAQIDACKERLERLVLTSPGPGSLARLKSSVLKQAFEGKLVPQDLNDESVEIKRLHKGGEELKFKKNGLPNRWIKTSLKNCVSILDNRRIPINSNERAERSGNVPYYGATGQVGWIDDYLFDEDLVLLGEDGAPFFDTFKDKAYTISGKSWVNNHAHVLRGMHGVILNNLLCYFLNQFDYKDYVTGTTRLKLNQSRMKSIPVLLPPLPEQHRIVAKIESIFARIDAKCRSIALAISQDFLLCLMI